MTQHLGDGMGGSGGGDHGLVDDCLPLDSEEIDELVVGDAAADLLYTAPPAAGEEGESGGLDPVELFV